MVLLQTSWRRGSKDSRGQGFKGLFFKDFISAFNILSISAMSFARLSNLCNSLALSAVASLCVTRTLESLTPLVPSGITPVQLEITHLFCLN